MLNGYSVPATLPYTYSLGTLTVNPTLPEQAGNYTINFAHSMTYDSLTTASYDVTIVVCPSSVFYVTPPKSPNDKKYTLGDKGINVSINDYSFDPSYCFAEAEFVFKYNPRKPTVVTEFLSDRKLRILGINLADVGTYTITASLSFNDTTTENTDVSFELEIIEPEVETLNIISSDFDLLPKSLGTLSLTVGEDFS